MYGFASLAIPRDMVEKKRRLASLAPTLGFPQREDQYKFDDVDLNQGDASLVIQ
jgi:hypothetical protein